MIFWPSTRSHSPQQRSWAIPMPVSFIRTKTRLITPARGPSRTSKATGIPSFFWCKISLTISAFIAGTCSAKSAVFATCSAARKITILPSAQLSDCGRNRSYTSSACFTIGAKSQVVWGGVRCKRVRARIGATREIREHLSRTGIKAQVVACPENSAAHRIIYELPANPPLVSILIPTRDQPKLLRQCIEGVRARTSYPRFDFVIVDNDSRGAETKMLLDELRCADGVTVIEEKSEFNFSRLVNTGADVARGELLALINDDVMPENPEWLGEMVSQLLQPGVGAVGARLWYPDGRLQHGGVIVGLGGVAGHAHYCWPHRHPGYFHRAIFQQKFSVVTAACMVVSKSVFKGLGRFDEENLGVSFNDIDFCLRMVEKGLRIVWTPHANLVHHESASRRRQFSEEQKLEFRREAEWMQERWSDTLAHDPYYNPNLSLSEEGGFTLAWPPRLPPLGVSLNSVTGDVLSELF